MAKDGAQVQITLPIQGRLESTWTSFRPDDGDSTPSSGEVALTPASSAKAKLEVGDGAQSVTLTAVETWTESDEIVITYKTVAVPTVAGHSHSYVHREINFVHRSG